MATYIMSGLPGEDEFEVWVAYHKNPHNRKRFYVTVNGDRFFNYERSAYMAVTRALNKAITTNWGRQNMEDLCGRILERKDFTVERVRIILEVVPE